MLTHPSAATTTININGARVFVAIRRGDGSGPPLLLINGIGANLEVFDPFIDALDKVGGEKIGTIRFDVPGVGESPPTLFFALFTGASSRQRVPYDLLLIELILDGDWKQLIAGLCHLARDQELPLIVLTTSDLAAIAMTQAAFPGLCVRQLPLPLGALLSLIQAQGPSTLSAALPSDQ